jgi:AsmA-like C-terminal region
MDLGKPEELHAQGQLRGLAITTTAELAVPVVVERFNLTADGHRITLSDTVVSSGANSAQVSGSVYREDNRFVVDGDVRADRIVLPKMARNEKDGNDGGGRTFKPEDLPVAGRIGVDIRSIEAGSLKLAPLVAEARVSGKKLDLRITQAALCGITLAGGVTGEMDDLQLTGTLSARDAPFGDSISCLTEGRVEGSGSMDVEARLAARGALKSLLENLAGTFSLIARDGNLEKFDVLNRVFAVLNVTEVALGKELAFSEKGMRYRVTNVKGTLESKVLHFDELTLDAPTVYLAATGRIDYGSGKMAMDVLVAPLQTANAILDKIPLLNRIFGSAILALPVQVVGTVQHPIVVPLGPGAVATRMTSIIANTLKLPFDAIKVFSPNADPSAKMPDANK